VLALVLAGCKQSYTPKPNGYLRVHYPEKEYLRFDDAEPFAFEYPVYAEVRENISRVSEPWWYDVVFPEYKGTIHLSYKHLDDNIEELIEDSRVLVYKHTSRSDGISETPFIDRENRRYGILYDLEGNVASSVQFFLTDSVEHFLRGSLYFMTTPNRDSLNPVIDFVRADIEHLIESLEWK